MLLDIIKKGSTDRSVTLRIVDSTDGTPETGVVFNTSGIDLWYRREGAAKVSITEATLSALTDAHSDGGFLHIGDGYYRLDLPDAAFATGANHVDVGGTVTGMVVIGGRVKLEDVYIQSGIKKNQAWNNFPFKMLDASTGVPMTGLTVTATRRIDSGAFGAGTLGAVSEVGSGWYQLNIPAADLNGDTISLEFTATGAKTNSIVLRTDP